MTATHPIARHDWHISERPVNRSRRSVCLLLFTLSLWPPGVEAIDLPDIGDTSESVLSLAEEERLGAAFMRNLRSALNIVSDPEIESYITALGARLTTNSERQQPFHFFVVNDSAINAFAGPGGYIGVNSGLIMTSETESELASVVAHEIAHVTQRHIARAFEDAKKSSVPTAAAIIAAIILASQDSQVGEAALATALAGSTQKRINFTRQNEKEADRIGMSLLASSGFDPQGMPAFFERLYRNNRGSDSLNIEYLRTHPLTLSRVTDTRNRAVQYAPPPKLDQLNYLLIKTKLQVLDSDDSARSVELFRLQLQKEDKNPQASSRYGYALSLARAGEFKEAIEQIQILIKNDPERVNYQIAAAGIALSAGDLGLAASICEANLKLFPHNHALTTLYAMTLTQQGSTSRAAALLYEHLRRHSNRPQLYQLLARAEHRNQNLAASHEALAEFYYLMGSSHSAIEQLDIGLKQAGSRDEIHKARMKFRRRQIEEEMIQSKQ